MESEADAILTDAMPVECAEAWSRVDAFRESLKATGVDFGDSLADLRADRER